MLVQQFFVDGLAHISYLLGGTESCAIIDPKRDVDDYIAAAEEEGLQITHILETHLHADFVSGHMDLAEKTGAAIYAPKAGKCAFDHVAVSEGDEIEIEDMVIRVLDTSGHTAGGLSFHCRQAGVVIVGDAVFLDSVGRCDIPGGDFDRLIANIRRNLLSLPPETRVLSGHGPETTIGREARHNGFLRAS